jgi:hypothetical protein
MFTKWRFLLFDRRNKMFDQLIAIGELLINGLSSLRLRKNKKRSLGKYLSSLHRDLSLLLENGDNILKLFKQHNNGKKINIDKIKKLLLEQHILIHRLTKVLMKRDIQTILSIQSPEITPLQFLLFEKGFRVKFYLDKINEQEKQRYEGSSIEWIRPRVRIDLPNNSSINNSRKQLRKIQSLTEELRKYILEHFEINEII